MKLYRIALLTFFSLVTVNAKYHLVWRDEFQTNRLDRTKWYMLQDCSGRGNSELQCYTNRTQNVRVENGNLLITAHVENYDGKEFTSGRVHAVGPGWKYGRFEVRARLPKGSHLWPAIWLVPVSRIFGAWPRSGEIDIMEQRGQQSSAIEATIHFGANRTVRSKFGSGMVDFAFDFSSDYHVFGLDWDADHMNWTVDGLLFSSVAINKSFNLKGVHVYKQNREPFDQPFKFILNIAVGGSYFPRLKYGQLSKQAAYRWEKPTLEIDWVRVWQRNE